MEDLVRVSVADAAEQPRIGEGALQCVVFLCQCASKVGERGIEHFERAAIKGRERRLTLDQIERRALLIRLQSEAACRSESRTRQTQLAWNAGPFSFHWKRPAIIR